MGRRKITEPLEVILRRDFTYDPETGYVYKKGKKYGTYDAHGYLVGRVRRKNLKVHRIAWFLYYGGWPTLGLDHINRVKDDNRITNLREVTQKENNMNVGLRSDNKSGYKNVSWDNAKSMWTARKHVDGVYKFFGYYNCPTAAYFSVVGV